VVQIDDGEVHLDLPIPVVEDLACDDGGCFPVVVRDARVGLLARKPGLGPQEVPGMARGLLGTDQDAETPILLDLQIEAREGAERVWFLQLSNSPRLPVSPIV
jgi:hypothetical protein